MSHYYSEKPTSKSDIKEIEFQFLNKNFTFLTDSGVFSKNKIDFGSELMLKTFFKHSNLKEGKFLDLRRRADHAQGALPAGRPE